jgi:hypothetical protein
VVPTKEIYLIAFGEPCVMFAASSKLFFARRWMTAIVQYRHSSGRPFPSYARQWLLTTALIKGTLGSWYGLQFRDSGWAPEDLFHSAEEFNRLVESGRVRVAQDNADAD